MTRRASSMEMRRVNLSEREWTLILERRDNPGEWVYDRYRRRWFKDIRVMRADVRLYYVLKEESYDNCRGALMPMRLRSALRLEHTVGEIRDMALEGSWSLNLDNMREREDDREYTG